ncbi:MAG TPA: hypothetical protein VGK19_00555 [Capsulimonadaceae bacterium]|jgi:hypothetical protein
MRSSFSFLIVAVALASSAYTPAVADELATPPVVPSATKVLIVPTLDETGDKPEMRRAHIATGNHRSEYELLIRGFQLIAPDEAVRAARKEDIDLDDSESRGKRSLLALGKDTGANWVVSLSVVSVREEQVNNFFSAIGNQRRAKAKIQLRILDVAANQYITNRFCEDTKTNQRVLGNIGTTGLFKQAIDTTIQRAYSNVMSSYPIIKKIDGEFDEGDLVTGQDVTKPSATPVPVADAKPAPAATDEKK